jgi:hypothetical protein
MTNHRPHPDFVDPQGVALAQQGRLFEPVAVIIAVEQQPAVPQSPGG